MIDYSRPVPEEPKFVLAIYTIYQDGSYLAQPYTVRQWRVNGSHVRPGWQKGAEHLGQARALVPKGVAHQMARSRYDDATIVESWL